MNDYLLIGLGNVGPRFEETRHNIGVRAVKAWAAARVDALGGEVIWRPDHGLQAEVCELVDAVTTQRITALFPFTMMNDSGKAVVAFLRTRSVPYARILIIHDDMETAFGEMRIKQGGSAKGHNGVRSIYETMGTQEIPRLLIGVGRPAAEVPAEAFVLQKFSEVEAQEVDKKILSQATEVISDWLKSS